MTFDGQCSGATASHYVDGLTYLRTGELPAAISLFRAVLLNHPSHLGARRNLIRALLASGEHDAVIVETAGALQDVAESAELQFLRGTAFNALSRPTEAIPALTASVALNPKFAPAWLNLGNAFMDAGDIVTAEAHCRQALDLDPALIEAWVSLGFILTEQGRLAEAIVALETAIEIEPANVQAHWNLATAALLAGDLPRGFEEYEWRKRHDLFRRDFINLPGPVWDGGDPAGFTILVHAEQGFGDTIQFARYLPLIARNGGKPVLACDPTLVKLLGSIPGIRVVSKFAGLPLYDAWIDQMSLPRVFGTTAATIPYAQGYLSADAFRGALPPARRIGVAWAGNPLHRNDRRRTPSEDVFRKLADTPGCRFISLMPGRALSWTAPPPLPLSDHAETAALIAALDLVITVDTSVAHVAGALGRPAWVLLPYAPDWRWLLNRNDTPWYNSVRLFRQPYPGDWASVIAEVAAALAG
jgi:tetratricopeptide (TPR) repeat protein